MTSRSDYHDAPVTTGDLRARRPTPSIAEFARECVELKPGVLLVKWIGDSHLQLWLADTGRKGWSVCVASGTRDAMIAAAGLQR